MSKDRTSNRLADRVAFVTGASSGIGRAITVEFAEQGAYVIVADKRRTPKLADESPVFDRLDEIGADYHYTELDVSGPKSVEDSIDEAIEKFGRLNIVVNNAGVYYQDTATNAPVEDWNTTMNVNLRGAFLVCKEAVPHLREEKNSKIINLASMYGIMGAKDSAAYCASKGGVANFTRQLALDYAEDHINVNALAPGIIKTAQNVEWRESDPELVAKWE